MNNVDEAYSAAAKRGVRIEVRLLKEYPEEGAGHWCLIQGDRDAFLALASIFELMATSAVPTKKQVEPDGAGSALFTRASDLGLYLDRI